MSLKVREVSDETRQKMSKNNACYWKGKTLSVEHRRKLSEAARACTDNPSRFKKGHAPYKYWLGKKRPCISILRTRTQTGRRGKDTNNWKGGITPIGHQIRNSSENIKWRLDVFERDNFTCQNCKQRGGYLEAHHIESFKEIFHKNKIKTLKQALECERFWDINNGLTLCKECHNETK